MRFKSEFHLEMYSVATLGILSKFIEHQADKTFDASRQIRNVNKKLVSYFAL